MTKRTKSRKLNKSHDSDDFWQTVAEREVARPMACHILQVCAFTTGMKLLEVAGELGHSSDGVAASLALEAWEFCAGRMGWIPGSNNVEHYKLICGEAEAMLQRGWSTHVPAEWC